MSQVDWIVAEVLKRLGTEMTGTETVTPVSPAPVHDAAGIPAEMSARHVHLSTADLQTLFNMKELPVSRAISQPGQFLSTCRVRLIGPKGSIDNVAVLGPTRERTQVELSATDCRTVGIRAPVRLSGDLSGAAAIHIQAEERMLCAKAAIVACRHLHMTPDDAARYGVANGSCVSVRVLGERPLILEDVPVRVSDQAALALHIDTDEANAAGLPKDGRCEIWKCGAPCSTEHAPIAPTPNASMLQTRQACDIVAEGKLITEAIVRDVHKQGIKRVCLRAGQLITPLARDTARQFGIEITCETGEGGGGRA